MKKNQVCFAIVPRGPSVGNNDQVISKVGNDRVPEEIIDCWMSIRIMLLRILLMVYY